MGNGVVDARIYPAGLLATLSRAEVERLHDASRGDLAALLRRCSLAVLNSGNQGDDAEALLEEYASFDIAVQQFNRGIRVELQNAPGTAFVDGEMIEGIRELLSAVIRDLVYYDSELKNHPDHCAGSGQAMTNGVFEMLRNAHVIHVMDRGTLLESGTHDELIALGGHYAYLYELQFREAEPSDVETTR